MSDDKPVKSKKSKVDLVAVVQGKRKDIAKGKTHYCVVSGKHSTLAAAQKAFIAAYEDKGPYADGGIHWRVKPVVTHRNESFWIVARFSIG